MGGEAVVSVAPKVCKTGLDVKNFLLKLGGEGDGGGEGGIRFFFKLGDVIHQYVVYSVIRELPSLQLGQVRCLFFERWRVRSLQVIWVF